MYRIKYYSEYDDIYNNRIRLEILFNGYTGVASELTLAHPAITIEYKIDDIFKPLKKSGASINLLVPNVIEDLFSGELINPQIRIKKNGSLFWFGYITPNIYSQPYKDELDLLTLECVDSISNLANLDFEKSNIDISSFIDIICNLLDKVDSEKVANNIYIPRGVKLGNESDILGNLYIQERNFYDEENEAQKSDEVISDILQYLGFTLMQYQNNYYIISVDCINDGDNSYYIYNRNNDTISTTTLNFTPRDIMDIGIGKGKGTVSLGGVYNKVTVIANNNPLGTILPEFDDEDDIVNQNVDPDKTYEQVYEIDDKTYTLLSGYFKSKSNWNYTQPMVSGITVSEVTQDNLSKIYGVTWQKVDSYNNADGEPSGVKWKLYLSMLSDEDNNLRTTPNISLASTKKMILDGGYLIANIKYKFSTDKRAHNVVKSVWGNPHNAGTVAQNLTGQPIQDLNWTSNPDYIGYDNWPNNTNFRCKITIGGYYYNGEEWISYETYNAKVNRGYYSWTSSNIHGYAPQGGKGTVHKVGDWEHWYRIRNSYNDWIYVTKDVYESNTSEKESGYTKNNNHFYYVNGSGVSVQMCIDYYYEMILLDCFYLVHKNSEDESVYDTEYSLTNTVSYKMNIIDSEDGVAIKCPDDINLYGDLMFQLFACDKLGNNPQYRTDKPLTTVRGIHISDLTLKYTKVNSYNSIYSNQTSDPDVKYSNVINSGYCQEMDDIEMRVNTASDIATSYSYAMGLSGTNYYYIDELNFNGENKKPEEKAVERYVNYYSSPKYTYSNVLTNDNITPYTILTESNLNKTMLISNITFDLSDNNAEVTANQL